MKSIFVVSKGCFGDIISSRAFLDKQKAENYFCKKYANYKIYPEDIDRKFYGGRKVILSGNMDYGTWAQLVEIKT